MNLRTKLLVLVMMLVGVAVFGDRAYRQLVEEPARNREKLIERLDRQISEAEDEIVKSARASDQLLAYEAYSLPYDQEMARARYQDWLLKLVEQVKLQQPSVDSAAAVPVSIKDPVSRKSKVAYHRYSFSLRGRGSLDQVADLLFRFYQGGHLQKIRSISLNPVAGGRLLELSLAIEAIGLDRVERKDTLSTLTAQRMAFAEPAAYHVISRRNVFSQEGDARLSQVILSAVTTDRKGVTEAWFAMGDGQRPQILRRGDSLAIPSHQIRILNIEPQSVSIDVDGTAVSLKLGKSIQDCLTMDQPPG